jgi:ABC-type nitrate/sulfonate/bicarbonate transport system permease component
VSTPETSPVTGSPGLALALRGLKSLAMLAISIVVMIGLWYAFIHVWHLNPFFAKSPRDVWLWLTTGPKAAANRHIILKGLATTLTDAALGFIGGTVIAVFVAIVFVLYAGVEDTLMPIALVLRSVPLVAMTPLLVLMFGRGLLGAAVIAGLVTFFPTLVNMVQGLRSVPAGSVDLMRVLHASKWTVLRTVRLPHAMPSLFASARIATPLALLGATLAEWLATGVGLGNLMISAASTSQFDMLWAAVVTVTTVSVVGYMFIGWIESPVIAHFNPNRAK